jgi:hypothetical protein
MTISKTLFQYFLCCPKNAWLKLHKPELREHFSLSDFDKHLMEQGNDVESYAHNLFPNGIEVASTGQDACNETERLMAAKVSAIFQATFIADDFLARNDVLCFNPENNCWDLYEVKGSNSLKEHVRERDHITDVAFQVSVLKRSGIALGRFYVIHVNKDYVRTGELDFKSLFITEDVTEKVSEKLPEVENQMVVAKEYLTNDKEPAGPCDCLYRGKAGHCSTFRYSNPKIPEYSVHYISNIHKTKLEKLIEAGIVDLNDISEDFALTEKQRNQVTAHQRQQSVIDKVEIKKQLDALRFPLYFFDYEATGPAIPAFNGYGPYKRIPFQFSLHILRTPEGELEHIEYLHPDLTDPTKKVAQLLKQHILPGGTVIAWHKSYEEGVDREISIRLPDYAEFFENMNKSFWDLKEIFSKQHYIHHGFHGSASLKKVQPVIAPNLPYKELDIQEGGEAVDAWWKMVSPRTSPEEKQQIEKQLKIYCGQDTYIMYVIWKHLYNLVNETVLQS